ncbi:MAG: DUF4013 domain-containing protein [Anaerolineae bacterium]|nr:DUF4013 domain-containing protein [Anaerolineae bacterium]
MDFGQAFTYIFKDEEWIKKVLLGIVLSIVPIFGQLALTGYIIVVIRNVKANDPRPLPDWNEIGQYFMDGLKLFVVSLIYSLPALILACPAMLVGFLPAFLPLLAGDEPRMALALTGISTILILALSLLPMLYSFFLTFLSPVLLIRLAETGEISDCLRFKEVMRFAFANIGPLIIALLVVSAAALIIVAPTAMLTLGLSTLPLTVWLQLVFGHLCGQIARKVAQPAAI